MSAPRSVRELVACVRADYARTRGGNPLNPAVTTAAYFRLSQYLWRRGRAGRGLAKLIEWHLVRTVGSQLSPSAEVGPGLLMPHPIGIVLGGRTRLGSGVLLGQNVTLGAGRERDGRDQPTVEDGVRLLAGSVIAGGVTIGAGATVGANAVVTGNVPAGETIR